MPASVRDILGGNFEENYRQREEAARNPYRGYDSFVGDPLRKFIGSLGGGGLTDAEQAEGVLGSVDPFGMGAVDLSQERGEVGRLLAQEKADNPLFGGRPATRANSTPTGVVRPKGDPAVKGSGASTPVNSVGPLAGGYAASDALAEPGGAAPQPTKRRGSIKFSTDGGKTFKEYDPDGGDQVNFEDGPGYARTGSIIDGSVALPGGAGNSGGGVSGEIVTPESEARKKRAEVMPGLLADLEIEHGKRQLERERPVGDQLPPLTAGEALKMQAERQNQEAKRQHAAQAYAKLEAATREIEASRQRFVQNPNDPTGRSPDAYHNALEAIMRMYAADIGDPRFLPTKPREEFGAGVGQ